MESVFFRFYGELNEFLPLERRQVSFAYPFKDVVSVKHLIEAIGVPHTEVELILVNGESVDFTYLAQPADRISVYPAFATLDVSSLVKVRPPLPHPPAFLLDIHLGQLATYLRLLGFDALFPDNGHSDEDLARLAHEEGRVLLSRDRGLLKRSLVVYGYCLRSRDPQKQLMAVLHRFRLFDAVQPWQRCLKCNGRLHAVAKEAILDRLQPKTKLYYDEFQICQACDQVYWKGSHYQSLQAFLDSVVWPASETNQP